MGYSCPKKQLDLKEFLSTPAKKRPGAKGFGFRKYPAAKAEPAEDAPSARNDEDN
ncbi:hypothetical protein [Tropicimonas sp. IMCC6043]|uniref:hypothetical protein n=1 Tax=Tropicimonas sp. IMCC6043 TaxID=2510645 RepID=UPI0013ED3CF3|nr:hypothetical protein [Tropicimonas sp. IMCC6043]